MTAVAAPVVRTSCHVLDGVFEGAMYLIGHSRAVIELNLPARQLVLDSLLNSEYRTCSIALTSK